MTELPWLVTQNGVVCCGVGMKLTRQQAENVVDNAKRDGCFMEVRRATKAEINPPIWIEEECDD